MDSTARKRQAETRDQLTPQEEQIARLAVALFWFSADGPYGQPEWGFAVDGSDVVRFVITALLVGIYVALWLERRAAGVRGWRARAQKALAVRGRCRRFSQ